MEDRVRMAGEPSPPRRCSPSRWAWRSRAFVVLHERLAPRQLAGLAVIAAGIGLLAAGTP